LFPWVVGTVEGKENIKKTGQQAGDAVIEAHQVEPMNGFIDLFRIGKNSVPQDGDIFLDDVDPQGFGVELAGLLLEVSQPRRSKRGGLLRIVCQKHLE